MSTNNICFYAEIKIIPEYIITKYSSLTSPLIYQFPGRRDVPYLFTLSTETAGLSKQCKPRSDSATSDQGLHFVIYPTVLDKSIGSKMDLFKL